MNSINKTRGFESVEDLLTAALHLRQQEVQLQIRAAAKISSQIFKLVPDGRIRAFLCLEARDELDLKGEEFMILPEWEPLTLLQQMVYIGITQAQKALNLPPARALVTVSKEKLYKIPGIGREEDLADVVRKIKDVSNGFIEMWGYNTVHRSESHCFTFICRYDQKIPVLAT